MNNHGMRMRHLLLLALLAQSLELKAQGSLAEPHNLKESDKKVEVHVLRATAPSDLEVSPCWSSWALVTVEIDKSGFVAKADAEGSNDCALQVAKYNVSQWQFGPFPEGTQFPVKHNVLYTFRNEGPAATCTGPARVEFVLPGWVDVVSRPWKPIGDWGYLRRLYNREASSPTSSPDPDVRPLKVVAPEPPVIHEARWLKGRVEVEVGIDDSGKVISVIGTGAYTELVHISEENAREWKFDFTNPNIPPESFPLKRKITYTYNVRERGGVCPDTGYTVFHLPYGVEVKSE
jgi:hypothetical protein